MIPDPFHEFPEFDVQDWSRLNLKNIPNRRIIGFINTCLQDREFRSLMMHQYGSLVLSASKNLLTRTQKELMEPLGYLMMVVKGNGRCLDLETDWRKIKQSQRARILREYWERLRKRKNLMRTLAQAYTRGRADPNHIQQSNQNPNLLTVFTEHFSAKGRDVREYNDHLNDIIKCGLSRLLPWRQILMHQSPALLLRCGLPRAETYKKRFDSLEAALLLSQEGVVREAKETTLEALKKSYRVRESNGSYLLEEKIQLGIKVSFLFLKRSVACWIFHIKKGEDDFTLGLGLGKDRPPRVSKHFLFPNLLIEEETVNIPVEPSGFHKMYECKNLNLF